jgi:hypothetical protein
MSRAWVKPPSTQLAGGGAFQAIRSESDTAFVAFSALSAKQPRFHFFFTLEPLAGISKLLVRDPAHSWYNAGLPGVGNSVDDIVVAIRHELTKLGAKRVVTTGTSMGGYAAILFGCLLGAERAIALCPQTLLDPVLPYSPPENVPLQVPDLRPVILGGAETKIDLVAGWDSMLDVFHAQRVAQLPSVRVLSLPQMGHTAALTLKRIDALTPLITDLADGRTPERCDVAPPLAADLQARIAGHVFAMAQRDWEGAATSIRLVAERYPDWAGPWFSLGEALARLSDWAGVEEAQRTAIDANPMWFRARILLGQSLVEQGRAEEAVAVYRAAISLEPEWPSGHRGLGECLTRLGRHDEAGESLRRAAELVKPR